MSETRTRYDTGPLTPEQRDAIRDALQQAIRRLQTTKDHIDDPRPITAADCDALLTQLEDVAHALATARALLE